MILALNIPVPTRYVDITFSVLEEPTSVIFSRYHMVHHPAGLALLDSSIALFREHVK